MSKFKLIPNLIAPPKFSAKAEMAMCISSIIHLICPRHRYRDFIVLNFVGRKVMELKMLELILFRHGQTESNPQMRFLGITDIPLDDCGVKQVANSRYVGKYFDAIYASPLSRTMETAKILRENMDIEIVYIDEIKERNFGIFDNLTIEEMREADNGIYSDWQANLVGYKLLNGESAKEAYGRIGQGIEKIFSNHKSAIEGHKNEKIMIVSHLNAIRFMLSYILGFSIESGQKFDIKNAGVVKLEIRSDRKVIVFE